ncbi:hypothetical protein NPIL_62191 [Nephila pilipes]|uniref:Uncharacterized protein n=1 Tax=Nephila pilipes TaxID=299642 RepID=A0A8X6UGT2_NEPPI|nr:hypothetical protein NPIL_62191 [Nephila pilipes]
MDMVTSFANCHAVVQPLFWVWMSPRTFSSVIISGATSLINYHYQSRQLLASHEDNVLAHLSSSYSDFGEKVRDKSTVLCFNISSCLKIG